MRKIDKLIVHCSATQEGRNLDAAEINRWHLKRGWKGIGYHYVVLLDGTIEYGRNIYEQGAHVKNHNKISVYFETSSRKPFWNQFGSFSNNFCTLIRPSL